MSCGACVLLMPRVATCCLSEVLDEGRVGLLSAGEVCTELAPAGVHQY